MDCIAPAPRLTSNKSIPRLAIVGGGMAGMAAALAGVEHGLQVDLFEQALALGGRAGSFQDTHINQQVDFSPHISMGCCTNLTDFCGRTGLSDAFNRYRTLHFFGPNGQRYDFAGSRWLPAPLHLLPGLLSLGYLSLGDRLRIARALLRLIRENRPDAADGPTMAQWLAEARQSASAISGFWSIVLVSALGDTLEHVSAAAARKVFVDGFCAHQSAYEVLVPKVPLGQLWQKAGQYMAERGVRIHLKTSIDRIDVDASAAKAIVLGDGSSHPCEFIISAVSWKQISRLLGNEHPICKSAGVNLAASPITAAHLWFDRPITKLPHAAIVGRLSQWLFALGHDEPPPSSHEKTLPSSHHYAVVISASHALAGRDLQDVRREVLDDLAALWPESQNAALLHSRILTQAAAVFSASPGCELLRPPQTTELTNLFLAGDWTSTGWPATMEGGVRSGYQAVEALLTSIGQPRRLVQPDLRKGMLVSMLLPRDRP